MSTQTYKPTLIRMMAFLDDQEYANDQAFTIERLGQVTASDVLRWFNSVTYGVPEPPTGHDLNPQTRSNTLKYWKKVISFFYAKQAVDLE